jgi:hypothetical protein
LFGGDVSMLMEEQVISMTEKRSYCRGKSMALRKKGRWDCDVARRSRAANEVAGGEEWNGMRLCGNTDDVADRSGGVDQPDENFFDNRRVF